MTFDEYMAQASKTAQYDRDDLEYHLMYLCMGLAGEGGEVIEKIKKIVRNDKGAVSQEKRDDLKKELGDVLWYLSQMARELNLSFDEVAEANIKKLADRAQRGVIKSEGDTR
jgi:NTP pyrophosphatase (non-canonical NTP hydrolase)